MKKIGVLTFHRALNYGAVLQAYGLVETLKKITSDDYIIEIIDYRCPAIEKTRSIKTRLSRISIKNILRCFLLINKRHRFGKFNSKLPISEKKYGLSTLDNLKKEYTAIIVGSDQVWNSSLTDSDLTYLLNFDFENKYSYAASIGQKEICVSNTNDYKKLLKEFKRISIREKEGKNILKDQLNIDCDGVHLDPALLLTQQDWNKLIESKKKEKYILVYNVLKPKYILKAAQEISKKTGYKIKFIPNGINPKMKNTKKYFPDVIEFLTLFKNAEYVLTNSFHGTVFSIIFNKQMLVELKENGTGNDRIITLLNSCKLSSRILDINHIDNIYNPIDWNEKKELLEKNRSYSISYLNKIISEIEGKNEK